MGSSVEYALKATASAVVVTALAAWWTPKILEALGPAAAALGGITPGG